MKILVVEDDPSIAQVLQFLFANHNYAVDIAADGEAGLQMADAYEYDLILLDLVLPKLDGISLCQQLRAKGFQSPILLLTGQGDSQQKAIALNAGADDYVVKPFDAEELMARVQALLRRSGPDRQPVLTWGHLSVDPSHRRIAYGTDLLSVTPKEYAILELLLRTSQRALSSREILDHVWTSLETPGEEVIRFHIKELRQKLIALGAPKDFIKTRHREGYQLNPLYSSLVSKTADHLTAPQLAALNAVNEELRATLEQLRSTQAQLQQKNQELQAARDELEQRVADRAAELVQSQARLSQVLDSAVLTIASFRVFDNRDWQYEYWSAGCEQLFGYTTQELMADQTLWMSQVVPEDRETILMPLFETFFAERNVTAEYRFHHRDGSIRWISSTYASRRIAPNCWLITAVNHDISGRVQLETERKHAETALQLSEEQRRLALDLTGTASWDLNLTTGEVVWSDNMFHLLGLTPSTASSTYATWRGCVYPADLERLEAAITLHLQNQTQYSEEYRVIYPDGSIHWLLSKGQGIYDAAGQAVRMVGITLDISDRKQTELALQQQIRQEYLLTDIAQDIRQSLNLDEVLSNTVHRVREFLDSDRVIIFRFRPNWQGDVIMESVGAEWISILGTTISDPCFGERYIKPYRQGRIATLTDIDTEGLQPCYVELLKSFQVKANLVVPILQGDHLWGLLIAHQCSAPRQWQPGEIALLRRLATQVGIAIQQSELYEQTQRELLTREQIQSFLEDSEARFRTLSAAAPIGILQNNADGICLYSNTRWQEISGLSFEDSLGNGWLQVVHPEDRDALWTAWEAYLQGGSGHLPEFRLLPPQGQIHWISARVAAMRSATGEITGHVFTQADITERKQAEQALRDSEQRLQAILDHSPAVIYLINPQNEHLLVNRSYANLVCTTPEHLVGKSIYEVWPADIADVFAANNRTVLETGQLLQTEEVAPHPDGQLHSYISVKFPLCDATGTPYAVCGISTDITDQKQLEAQFYRAQRLESLGTLASGIAHDLNNVLTPILTIAQLLRLKPTTLESRSEMLELLEHSARRGADMIKQILTFTRGTGGERVPIEIASVLQEILHIIQQSFPKSIQIRAMIPDPFLWLVSADATYLHQVLMNLCVNARDAMPDGGILTLSVEHCVVDQILAQTNLNAQAGNYVVVTIADTGTGIPPDVRDRIFEPFFTTKAPGKGTGLGLATVLGIVKNYGGFLQVFSEVGHGTQMKVYLPATEAGITTSVNQSEDPLDGNGELVLIVVDDVAVQRSTQTLLERHQYTTCVANGGAEAIALYTQQQHKIRVVILDIMMPDMNGIVLIQTLKTINPLVKIIAMSGLTANREPALGIGANIFLAKPYSSEMLLKNISDLLRDRHSLR
jgi:PAS domain S-box-containing protein